MRFFKFGAGRDQDQAGPAGETAVLDGLGAAVHVEQCAGATAALSADVGDSVSRGGRLWRCKELNSASAAPRIECDDELTALAAAVGMAEAGLRGSCFLSGAAALDGHRTFYSAAAKHLPLVIHLLDQALRDSGGSDLPGHDASQAIAGSGWFQLFAWDAQSVFDLGVIARRLAEQALVPGMVIQEAWSCSHRAMNLRLPEYSALESFLGAPADMVASPTTAQQSLYGEQRRRLPGTWDVDRPLLSGAVHGEGSYAEQLTARQFYLLDGLLDSADQVFRDYAALSGRRIAPLLSEHCDDAEYLIVAQGSAVGSARALASHLRKTRGLRLGVINIVMPRPLPATALSALLLRRRAVLVLEPHTRQLNTDPPLLSTLRETLYRALQQDGRETTHGERSRRPGVEDLPRLFGVSYGPGGRRLAPGELLAAVEQMFAGQRLTPALSLGVEYLPRTLESPKQQIFVQQLQDTFPQLPGPRTAPETGPRLLAESAVTIRVFARAGSTPFDSDRHPGTTLHELAGLHVQAWPATGRQRRNRVSVFNVVAASQLIDAAAETITADIIVAADAAAIADPRLAAALSTGGILLVLTDADTIASGQFSIPPELREKVLNAEVNCLCLPALAMAQREARDLTSQRRVLAQLLEGALLSLAPVVRLSELGDDELPRSLQAMLLRRDAQLPADELERELALWRRGGEALEFLDLSALPTAEALPIAESPGLRVLPPRSIPLDDLHHHWAAHPQFRGGDDVAAGTADPLLAAGVLPAGSGLLRDFSATRSSYPRWLPERCTGCGACWSLCPDSALSALVNNPGEVLHTGVALLEAAGSPVEHLPRAVRVLEGKWHARLQSAKPGTAVAACLPAAIEDAVPAVKALPGEQDSIREQLQSLGDCLQDFPLGISSVFFTELEAKRRGSGGLLSITLDPERCKACGLCSRACPEQAIEQQSQTPESLAELRRNWKICHGLPTTGEAFIALGESRKEAPGLETLLLDKTAGRVMVGGSDSDPGSIDNTVLRLFFAAATVTMRPRIAAHSKYLEQLIARLESHIRSQLAVDPADIDELLPLLKEVEEQDLTLAELSRRMDRDSQPIDRVWLTRSAATLSGLRRLYRDFYGSDTSHRRSAMAAVAATGPLAAVPGSYPYNPFVFPWSSLPLQSLPGAMLGAAEGLLARLAEGFRLVRIAELELDGSYQPEVHDTFFAHFDWHQFNVDEWQLCPTMVLVADDGLLNAGGASQLLDILSSGLPVKILCLDGQSYRSLAMLPGTLPPWGDPEPGTDAPAPSGVPMTPSVALLAVAQGRALVEQSSIAEPSRLLDGFRRGIGSAGPALFNVYRASAAAASQASSAGLEQSILALRSRAHPAYSFDPKAGEALHQRLRLSGNAQPGRPWPHFEVNYLDVQGQAESSMMPLTFAHYALAVPLLAHHFHAVDAMADSDALTPLVDYLDLDADEQGECRPCIEAVDAGGQLRPWLVSAAMVAACRQRREQWQLLRTLTREDIETVDEQEIAEAARTEVFEVVWRNLVALAGEEDGLVEDSLHSLIQDSQVQISSEELGS